MTILKHGEQGCDGCELLEGMLEKAEGERLRMKDGMSRQHAQLKQCEKRCNELRASKACIDPREMDALREQVAAMSRKRDNRARDLRDMHRSLEQKSKELESAIARGDRLSAELNEARAPAVAWGQS